MGQYWYFLGNFLPTQPPIAIISISMRRGDVQW
jgi:hypothetical protein